MSTFTVRPELSQLYIRASSSLHPLTYSAPVNGHVQAVIDGSRFDLDAPTSGQLWIDLHELKGDDPSWDKEMLDRLDAQRYPRVVAELANVTSRGNDRYGLSGTLCLHGTTCALQGDAQVVVKDARVHATGRVVVDIRDFGIELPRLLMLKVMPEVEIAVKAVAVIG